MAFGLGGPRSDFSLAANWEEVCTSDEQVSPVRLTFLSSSYRPHEHLAPRKSRK